MLSVQGMVGIVVNGGMLVPAKGLQRLLNKLVRLGRRESALLLKAIQ